MKPTNVWANAPISKTSVHLFNPLMALSNAIVLSTFYGLLCLLAVFSVHRLVLALRWFRRRRHVDQCALRFEDLASAELPTVLVQIPLYNEPNVARRVILSCAKLRYPAEKLTIQVLDDSTDGSADEVDAAVMEARRSGVNVRLLRRIDRVGFKAGALGAGLDNDSSELVAIFDADFVPQPEYLEQIVPEFCDPTIGMVQSRWGYLNHEENLLTRGQTALLDGHFGVEQASRASSGFFFNFNGTAGVWRRAAIDEAGGWEFDTLTEDLDISYRAQLHGWSFKYRGDLVVLSELPASLSAFRSQQHRWAKGGTETLRKLLRKLLRSDQSIAQKIEGTFHLAANLNYVWMLAIALLMPFAVHAHTRGPQRILQVLDVVLLGATLISMTTFYAVARSGSGRVWYRSVLDVTLGVAMDIGISLEKGRGALAALAGLKSPFVRTPKRGENLIAAPRAPRASSARSRAARALSGWFGEAAVAAWLLFGSYSVLASFSVSATGVGFLLIFAGSFGFIAINGLAETVRNLAAASNETTPALVSTRSSQSEYPIETPSVPLHGRDASRASQPILAPSSFRRDP